MYVNIIDSYRANDSKSLVSVFHYGVLSEKIFNASNVVYPCYYTHSKNRNEWESMAQNSISQIRAHNKKVPIYAFIWPQYNPEPKYQDLGYKFIEADFWKLQLETLYPLCDGVVIWSHYRDEKGETVYFDYNMPWFQETIKFIKSHHIR